MKSLERLFERKGLPMFVLPAAMAAASENIHGAGVKQCAAPPMFVSEVYTAERQIHPQSSGEHGSPIRVHRPQLGLQHTKPVLQVAIPQVTLNGY